MKWLKIGGEDTRSQDQISDAAILRAKEVISKVDQRPYGFIKATINSLGLASKNTPYLERELRRLYWLLNDVSSDASIKGPLDGFDESDLKIQQLIKNTQINFPNSVEMLRSSTGGSPLIFLCRMAKEIGVKPRGRPTPEGYNGWDYDPVRQYSRIVWGSALGNAFCNKYLEWERTSGIVLRNEVRVDLGDTHPYNQTLYSALASLPVTMEYSAQGADGRALHFFVPHTVQTGFEYVGGVQYPVYEAVSLGPVTDQFIHEFTVLRYYSGELHS